MRLVLLEQDFDRMKGDPRNHTNQHENVLSDFWCDFVDRIFPSLRGGITRNLICEIRR
jgi:hypothetical protein